MLCRWKNSDFVLCIQIFPDMHSDFVSDHGGRPEIHADYLKLIKWVFSARNFCMVKNHSPWHLTNSLLFKQKHCFDVFHFVLHNLIKKKKY